MIRVGVYLGTHPWSGGAFQYGQTLLETLAHLPRRDYEIVCAYSADDWRRHVDRFGFRSFRVHYGRLHLLYDRLLRNLGVAPRIWRPIVTRFSPLAHRLLDESCDVWIFPAQDSLSYQLPVTALVTIFDLMHRYERRFPEVGGLGRARRRDIHYRYISRCSGGIIVDSEVGRQHVVDCYGVDPSMIHVLPPMPPAYENVVDAEAVASMQLPPKYLFYPAQFWEHKNHEGLLRAIARCIPDAPDIAVVFAGSRKNAYRRVVQLTSELGLDDRVTFLGYVPDALMPALYRRARALIMPTFFGPTNIPPLEAFSFDCPVACSGIYAMPEQVGDAALLFDPRSVDQIADAVLRLWCDDELCASLVARGRRRLSLLSHHSRALQLQNMIEATCGLGRSSSTTRYPHPSNGAAEMT
jgi:glycosyltransferase involved in cell wall biosynthesis